MKKKGLSPVISTVILVAIAITVAVAVAYWMGGIAGQYTVFPEPDSKQPDWLPLPVDVRGVEHDLFFVSGKPYLIYLNVTDNQCWWTVHENGEWATPQTVSP